MERRNLPICDLTGGLECAVEKGWLMKDADSESWLLTELGYNQASGSYFYRHGGFWSAAAQRKLRIARQGQLSKQVL